MGKQIPINAVLSGYLEYRTELDSAIRRVLESGWYILGTEVNAFENAFAQYCGAAHAVGVSNGTDAIQLALRSLGVGVGDAVFTVSHTAVATVAAVELAGATPVLVDVDPLGYTIDLSKLESSIVECLRTGRPARPRAVVAVHLYGLPCDLIDLKSLCARHGLYLIEDCAQAHGATVLGKPVGSFGDAAAFSFYPTKNLGAFGDAGAVLFRQDETTARCRALREYGWFTRFESDLPGMNSRLDELQAAILGVRLQHLDRELRRRRQIAARYDAALAALVQVPQLRAGCEHAYHLYVVQCRERDKLRTRLAHRGVGTGIHYPKPVHKQPAYAGRVAIGAGGLAVTEELCTRIVSLPMHAFLSDEDVGVVIDAVASCLSSRDTVT